MGESSGAAGPADFGGKMRRLLVFHLAQATGAAFLIVAATQALASPGFVEPPRPEWHTLSLSVRDIRTESRLYCMALAVYFEGGSTAEVEEGQRNIARVIH